MNLMLKWIPGSNIYDGNPFSLEDGLDIEMDTWF